ncbi:2551_t:CDS:2 [Entrophospora sp. SA101]|nr:2551_t:CDS:2 [Entrophospora sp. SA101]
MKSKNRSVRQLKAVSLQGAATCLLTAARTLTANNDSHLENEKEEQRELDLLREFNSGDLKTKKDKNQHQNDAKDFVLGYFNSLIENDLMLKSFLKPGALDPKRLATAKSSATTSGKKKSKNKSKSDPNAENDPKKKRNIIKKPVDPNAPKKPASAFLLYQKDVQEQIRKEFPETKWNDVLRIISQRWQNLSNDEKKIYETKFQQARQIFEAEYKTYMENKDNLPPATSGVIEEGKENGDWGNKSDDTVNEEESSRTANKLSSRKTKSHEYYANSKAQNNSSDAGINSSGSSSSTSKKRKDVVDDSEDNSTTINKKSHHSMVKQEDEDEDSVYNSSNRQSNKDQSNSENLHRLSKDKSKDKKKKKPKDKTTIKSIN